MCRSSAYGRASDVNAASLSALCVLPRGSPASVFLQIEYVWKGAGCERCITERAARLATRFTGLLCIPDRVRVEGRELRADAARAQVLRCGRHLRLGLPLPQVSALFGAFTRFV